MEDLTSHTLLQEKQVQRTSQAWLHSSRAYVAIHPPCPVCRHGTSLSPHPIHVLMTLRYVCPSRTRITLQRIAPAPDEPAIASLPQALLCSTQRPANVLQGVECIEDMDYYDIIPALRIIEVRVRLNDSMLEPSHLVPRGASLELLTDFNIRCKCITMRSAASSSLDAAHTPAMQVLHLPDTHTPPLLKHSLPLATQQPSAPPASA